MIFCGAVMLSFEAELPHNSRWYSFITLVAAVAIVPLDLNAELEAE